MYKLLMLLIVHGIISTATSQDTLDWVITPRYTYIHSFHEGLAVIETPYENYLVINTKGDTVFVAPEGAYIGNFSEKMATTYTHHTFRYIDTTGKIIIPQHYETAASFKNGIAAVERDGFYGFINKQGATVIPFKYHFAADFSENLSRVGIIDMETAIIEFEIHPKFFGFIDKSGRQIVDCIYDDAGDFSEGLASVRKKNRVGYIDTKGKVVIPFQFQSANNFSEGLASVCLPIKGQPIQTAIDDLKYSSIGEEIKVINFKYGFINKKGRVVIPYQFEKVYDFSEGLAAVKDSTNKLWGFIDKTGNWVIAPQYRRANSFSEGLAAVQKGGNWGFIDKTGRLIIPMVFSDVLDSSEGLVAAILNYTKKWGYLRNPLYKNKK